MISRQKQEEVRALLETFPVTALLGPRQVGKTTLAHEILSKRASIYLDLESEEDRAKLENPIHYLSLHKEKLIILDEIQRVPELFQELRGIIDRNKREGINSGQFLILGSASIDLLKQSGETLAGRIGYCELSPVLISEYPDNMDKLWLRGGFPDSLLAKTSNQSIMWRKNFIRTYLERDIPQLGPRIPSETLRRFWTMLAHLQGATLNASNIAKSLGVDGKTVMNYLDLMVDLLLVRRLPPLHKNIGKRLIKSPKVYIRDSGLLHTLLNITDLEMLLSHPIIGMSWEGFVVENILNTTDSSHFPAYFYKTSSNNEIDLILERPNNEIWAIEIKRTFAPKITKGFRQASQDIQSNKNFIVYPGYERFPLSENIEAIGLQELMKELIT
ncbi:MAG: ATP-binding protein [Cyclobacteriaceae bacterium]